MYKRIEIVAKIELFAGTGFRKGPITNGYRPIFSFEGEITKISGRITLITMDKFFPGTIGVVKITFIEGMISHAAFKKGNNFTFGEGLNALGKGEVLEVSHV